MKTTIVKIGGTILENAEQRAVFLETFARIEGPKVLIHGGGKTATKLAELNGIQPVFIDGRRITTPEMLAIVTMSYTAINKEIVTGLQHLGVPAIGLCGADDNCIPAKKRNPLPIDFGMVGDPLFDTPISPLVKELVGLGITPVFSALSYDFENGTLLNTNADTIALFWTKQLARLGEVELIFAFEHDGVLQTLSDPDSGFKQLEQQQIPMMQASGTIHSGMIPKLDCGFKALAYGTETVRISRFDRLETGTQLINA